MECSSDISNAACVLMCLHMRQSDGRKVRGRVFIMGKETGRKKAVMVK